MHENNEEEKKTSTLFHILADICRKFQRRTELGSDRDVSITNYYHLSQSLSGTVTI